MVRYLIFLDVIFAIIVIVFIDQIGLFDWTIVINYSASRLFVRFSVEIDKEAKEKDFWTCDPISKENWIIAFNKK